MKSVKIAFMALLLGSAAQAANVRVFAAASLTEAFTEIGRAFDAKTGNKTTFQFAGSQALRTQIENGARADIFASANLAQYTPLVKTGQVSAARPFASNKLTVIASKKSGKVATLNDLTRPGTRIVIASPTVPVGDYTCKMLKQIDASRNFGRDFSARFMKNVVSEEPNVRQVALKVQLGEADAAVVYTTDVTPSLRPHVKTVPIPSRFNQSAAYPIGVVSSSKNQKAAQDFVQFVMSNDGQAILKKWGFGRPASR